MVLSADPPLAGDSTVLFGMPPSCSVVFHAEVNSSSADMGAAAYRKMSVAQITANETICPPFSGSKEPACSSRE